MNFKRRYFKLRPFAKAKKNQRNWGSILWNDAVKDVKNHYLYKDPHAKGAIGLVDIEDGNNHYIIPINSLNNPVVIQPLLSYLSTPNADTANWPLHYSFGHNIKYTCSCCKDTSTTPDCAAGCEQGELTCDSCGGEGGHGCDECDGEGNVECYECAGGGRIDCVECDGVGNLDCSYCGGSGNEEVECDICDGEGMIEDSEGKEEDCSACDGKGEITDTCSNCEGEGEVRCDDCAGQGDYECDYCDGYGSTGCEYCYEGWAECGDCGGGGQYTCSNCNGAWEAQACNRFGEDVEGRARPRIVEHSQSPRWQDENKIRLQSKDMFYKTELGNKIAVNYFKSMLFNKEYITGSGYNYVGKGKYFNEILKSEAERLLKVNKGWWQKIAERLGRMQGWSRDTVEVPWDYEKLRELFENETIFENYNLDTLMLHIPRKVTINGKGEVVQHIKPSTFPQFRFRETKKQMEYLLEYYTHPSWDGYLKDLGLKVSDIGGSGMVNILERKMNTAGWYYIAGEEYYSRSDAKPNTNQMVIEYHSPKYSLIGYEEEIFNEEGYKRNVGRSATVKLANRVRKKIGDDYKGAVVISTIHTGAAAGQGNNLTRNNFTSRHIIVFESPSSVDLISQMGLLGGYGWARFYCAGNSTFYRIAGNKLVVHKTGIVGWPKFPMVNVQDVKIISTNLKFYENPFINWKGSSPLDFDDKKS